MPSLVLSPTTCAGVGWALVLCQSIACAAVAGDNTCNGAATGSINKAKYNGRKERAVVGVVINDKSECS